MAAQAPDEIQIFVKAMTSGKILALDVTPAIDTVDSVKRKMLAEAKLPDDVLPRFGLFFNGKPLGDTQKLSECGVTRESTLTHAPRKAETDLPDKAVLDVLHKHLQNLQTFTDGKLFVFIGIGSYDHNHGTELIKRQQCPDTLLTWCKQQGWQLKVMLIDVGFVELREMPQIYNQKDQGWIETPRAEELEGKIRYFDNRDGKHQVTTYATKISEYGSLRTKGTVGGFDLNGLRAAWTGRSDRCLVAGNFYAKESEDYVTLGDVKVIAACGFKPQ